jgi:hypothetical protein
VSIQALLPTLSRLPRRTLVYVAAAGLAFAGQQAWAWKADVDTHVQASVSGYARLGSLELGQEAIREEMRRGQEAAERRDIEMRREMLEQFRWMADKFGDVAKTNELGRKLRDIDEEKP